MQTNFSRIRVPKIFVQSLAAKLLSHPPFWIYQTISTQSPLSNLAWLPSFENKMVESFGMWAPWKSTMFSRPAAKDTENDLLMLQEKFVTGRLNPAAAVVRSNTSEESRSLGEKRDAPCDVQVTRDVVTLQGEDNEVFETKCYYLYLS